MQELPELEIYRAVLAERFAGALITKVAVKQEKLIQEEDFTLLENEIVGKTVWFVERRAQHLIFHLDNGKRLLVLVSNSAYVYCSQPEEQEKADASLTLHFDGRRLSFFGLKAGDIAIMTVKAVEQYMKDRGLDPLDKRFSLIRLKEQFAKKKSSLKTALMDEKLLSGIGPVYSDEIAFAAGLAPDTKVASFDEKQWEKLHHALGSVLRDSISHGGAGERPLFAGDIFTGGFKERLQVYNREGETCTRCGGEIKRGIAGNRKTFACGACQKGE
ncbi:Fpg/Nei family DNA glycosylase [Paenibacillus sp. GCM10027627]|uniref:Fpg/Nei family DNA glycosylase n=1 Tax=unclassified Paenibacillus TaxID=185978 RepID=UPI00362A61F2